MEHAEHTEHQKHMEHAKHMPPEHEKMEVPEADHHLMMEQELRRRLIVAAIFTVPVLILSPTVQGWFNLKIPRFPGYDFVLLFLASVVAIYGGIFFYREAINSLKARLADMNVLVSLAVISGYVFSAVSSFFFKGMDFYWEISTLVVFLLFGHWMEMRAVRGTTGALRELVKLIPPTANLVTDGEVQEVPTSKLVVGNVVLVRPGEKIPIDGEIIEGETSVNEAMITGESKPVAKKVGSEVIGGSINGEGAVRVKVTKTGAETALAQIIKLVREAQASKPRTQKLADRAAHYLTIIAVGVGLLTLVVWIAVVGAPAFFAVTLAITVLVIACPHALGLAIPTVTTISTGMAAERGLLIKNAESLETARRVNAVIFDKTGTLTRGEFGVTDIVKTSDWDVREILEKAAAIEINSEHVIAKGIVKKAQDENIKMLTATAFEAIPGKGARGKIGSTVLLGNKALMDSLSISLDGFAEKISALASQGKSIVYLAFDGELKGVIALADIIREESREAIRDLKQMGIEVAMLTGDNKETAAYVAKELGLDRYFAEVLPEQKSKSVKELQDQGKLVAMVGDGINDAPALIQSNVGIAIGAGTDVAVESAQIVLVKNDPRDVVKAIRLSRLTMQKMRQNLAWATGYNAVAIPAAAGVFYPLGIVLRPEYGALLMTASSIIVVINALLMKRAQI